MALVKIHIFVCFLLLMACYKKEAEPFDLASQALANADIILFKQIVEENPSVVKQAREYDQVTLLHQACSAGYHPAKEKIIHFLVESGADVNAKDDMGRTPVHRVFIYGRDGEKMLSYFVKNGADLSLVDYNGKRAQDYLGTTSYQSRKE